jgi:hypothetical protein
VSEQTGAFFFFFLAKFRHLPKHFCPKKKKRKKKKKEVPKLLAQGILFCLNIFEQVYIWLIPIVDDLITHKMN